MANKTKVENKVRLLIMLLLSVLLFVFAVIFSQKNIIFNSNSKAREVEFCGSQICRTGYYCQNNKCRVMPTLAVNSGSGNDNPQHLGARKCGDSDECRKSLNENYRCYFGYCVDFSKTGSGHDQIPCNSENTKCPTNLRCERDANQNGFKWKGHCLAGTK